MKRRGSSGAGRPQRGIALLVMLVIVTLGMSWFAVTRLAARSNFVAASRAGNAEALQRAKQALIGWVARTAAQAGENNPGRLPCPEAAGYAGDPSQEGIAAGSCTLPKTGRLPWRTLGLDKPRDAAGEPLWYVVSPGWAFTSGTLTINSNTQGQLTVDGRPNAAVALLIAPGPAMIVQAAPGCAARIQTRNAPSPSMNARDYIECSNSATADFSSTGPAASFNDQVLTVTAADLLPAIEAAIAHRIEREVVPQLKSVYAGAEWGLTGSNPVFPFAAPFADPQTSSFQGAVGLFQGLLPFTATQGCSPPTDPRCGATFVNWNTAVAPTLVQTGGAGTFLPGGTCTLNTTTVQCIGEYAGAVQLRMSAVASNVAMALRRLDPAQTSVKYGVGNCTTPSPGTASGTFASDGSAAISISDSLPDLLVPVSRYCITANIAVLADHALLDPNDAITGWFVRNKWYQLAYYALSANHAASGTPPRSCTASPLTCLSVANVTPADRQRAILVLAGRILPGQTRPSGSVTDFLEFGNAASPAAFERQPVSVAIAPALKKPFNDRIIVVDANP